jgi:hypothetical protein
LESVVVIKKQVVLSTCHLRTEMSNDQFKDTCRPLNSDHVYQILGKGENEG